MKKFIPRDWRDALDHPVSRDQWRYAIKKLNIFLKKEAIEGHRYHPRGGNIFNAFRLTPFDSVRVVIIGQDPYPERKNATGLAFSMPPPNMPDDEVKLSLSIKRIYKAIENNKAIENSNVDGIKPEHGNLNDWARQNVLLLNRVLTFCKCNRCKANMHKQQGWEDFTEAVIKALNNDRSRRLHFMLWGGDAREIQKHINENRHTVLPRTSHPTSPSPYFREFLDCRHFSIVNTALGARRINWFPPDEN